MMFFEPARTAFLCEKDEPFILKSKNKNLAPLLHDARDMQLILETLKTHIFAQTRRLYSNQFPTNKTNS